MKRWTSVIALGLGVVLAASVAVQAKPKGATPPKDPTQKKEYNSIVGTVLKVDGLNINLQTHGKNAAEVTVPTDTKTEFEINGSKGTLEKIKPGMQVVVTPNTGIAQKVIVNEEGKAKDKKKKKKDSSGAGTKPASNGQ